MKCTCISHEALIVPMSNGPARIPDDILQSRKVFHLMVSFILFAMASAVSGAVTGATWVGVDFLSRRMSARNRACRETGN
jgi:hypothetical protein